MEIENRVIKTFSNVFNIDKNTIELTDTKENIEAWDSIGHLQLIMNIEFEFGIKLNTEDVVKMDSVQKCIEIVSTLSQ